MRQWVVTIPSVIFFPDGLLYSRILKNHKHEHYHVLLRILGDLTFPYKILYYLMSKIFLVPDSATLPAWGLILMWFWLISHGGHNSPGSALQITPASPYSCEHNPLYQDGCWQSANRFSVPLHSTHDNICAPLPSRNWVLVVDLIAEWKPSWRQVTVASVMSHPLSHTMPHSPL